MTNKDETRCKKCGRLSLFCICGLCCDKCGRPSPFCMCDLSCEKCCGPVFLCECDEMDYDGYDGCGGTCEQFHEITLCMICEAIINDDAVPGDGIYFCENCGDAICPDCAQPAVDEAGEIVFVCVACIDKNRDKPCG